MEDQFIISAEPGVQNFSVCVQRIDPSTKQMEIVHLELLENTIHSLLEKAQPCFNDQADFFADYFEKLFKKYKPKNVCMERYQIRGFRASGSAAELINVMLGICVSEARKLQIPFRLVIASEWKNDFNRHSEIPLKEFSVFFFSREKSSQLTIPGDIMKKLEQTKNKKNKQTYFRKVLFWQIYQSICI